MAHVNFESDLEKTFEKRMKESDDFCTQIWSALANIIWKHKSGEEYSCTFRYAGGMIADIIDKGGYMDWYCSGPCETVSDEIKKDMLDLGWESSLYDA